MITCPDEAERWADAAAPAAGDPGIKWDQLEVLRARGIAALFAHEPERAAGGLGKADNTWLNLVAWAARAIRRNDQIGLGIAGRTNRRKHGGTSVARTAPAHSLDIEARGDVGYELGRDALREWLRRGGKPARLMEIATVLPRAKEPLLRMLEALE